MTELPDRSFDRQWQKRLASSAAGEAWRDFLQRYSGLILSVIRRNNPAEQVVNDTFLFVCEKLVDNRFRRLRQWQSRKDARFETWLRAVTANLCVDYSRHVGGRIRAPRVIQELGHLEQRVFECRFGRGLKITDCLQVLQGEFPGLSEVQLAGVIGDLNRRLDSRQHWQLKARQQGFISLDDPVTRLSTELTEDRTPQPEQHSHTEQQLRRLKTAMATLSSQQRLLLRLRFEQDLPLRVVAQAAGLKDPYQARYLIDKSLEQLARLLAD